MGARKHHRVETQTRTPPRSLIVNPATMKLTYEQLVAKSRKDLQALAKNHKVKANQKVHAVATDEYRHPN